MFVSSNERETPRRKVVASFRPLQRIKHHFIDVTPTPLLTRLKGFYDRMVSLTKVLRSVAVR